jgi:hypothetical protein
LVHGNLKEETMDALHRVRRYMTRDNLRTVFDEVVNGLTRARQPHILGEWVDNKWRVTYSWLPSIHHLPPGDSSATCRPTTSAWRTQQEMTVTITSQRSEKVETIQIHDLVPRSYKVAHKLLLRVVTRIDFRNRSKLGVRTEDEVDAGAGPL